MNKFFCTLLLLLCSLIAAPGCFAQKDDDSQRRQWNSEMRQLRTNYVVKELKLTQDQADKFVPLYNAMSTEVTKISTDAVKMYKTVAAKGDKATNLEKEKAAEALYEIKGKENAIEMKYFNRFKTILSPDQLMKLKKAEHQFKRQLMNHRKDKKK